MRSYRATPHVTTNEAPASFLFGYNIHTALPEIKKSSEKDSDRQKHDKKEKEKLKLNADKRNVAREPRSLKPGDNVLIKQTKETRLASAYNPNPTVKVSGAMVITHSKKLGTKTRYVSHIKY